MSAGSTFRVLVADDDNRCRDSLELLLATEGFEILSAGGGLQALEVLRRQAEQRALQTLQRIHFLVMDYNMPDLNGLEVLRVIRQELNIVIPVIMVSGEAGPELERSVHKQGGFALAHKPIEPVSFRQLVWSLIQSEFDGSGRDL